MAFGLVLGTLTLASVHCWSAALSCALARALDGRGALPCSGGFNLFTFAASAAATCGLQLLRLQITEPPGLSPWASQGCLTCSSCAVQPWTLKYFCMLCRLPCFPFTVSVQLSAVLGVHISKGLPCQVSPRREHSPYTVTMVICFLLNSFPLGSMLSLDVILFWQMSM